MRTRPPLNPLIAAIAAPPIPEAQGWNALYDGRHGPVIDLSQAVPGHAPPADFLARLGEAAASADAARYGPILGDATLREAYAAECGRAYRADITAANIAITAGCNMAFMVAAMLVAAPGDDILLPSPWYFNHRMALDMLGIGSTVLPCQAARGFVPDPDEAARLIGPRTRAILLVTPNNPTGAIYPPETIARFADLARTRGLMLILDETYRDFLPDGTSPHGLNRDPEAAGHLIQLYSFSKAYAIPGHRLGAMIAPEPFIAEAAKILDTMQICPARPAQQALVWAIGAMAGWRREKAGELDARAQACRAMFGADSGFRVDSIGAYFAFVAHPFAGLSARAASRMIAEQLGIITLPGAFFDPALETHLRIAFANVDAHTLSEAGRRITHLAGATPPAQSP
jgi:aspartate/methionine/tyrosine aminotransferase